MSAATERTALAVVPDEDKEAEARRKSAILRAVGLDRAPSEQRELALAIARRYDLDLMLKHLVLIDGKPYVTRDALLWIAHRSGRFDGITVTKPVVVGDYWECEASVYRTDMSHPFTYPGRYPAKGGNQKFAPEMAIKVAESMALRRAFNISAPTQDERWDVETPVAHHADEQTAHSGPPGFAVVSDADLPIPESAQPTEAEFTPLVGPEVPDDGQPEPVAVPKAGMVQCESRSPFDTQADEPAQCRREQGHSGAHRTRVESWSDADAKSAHAASQQKAGA